ncbi:efflux RND transporter permease subunit [Colwellia sp. M166]|uniref:efflux RND transporter permease subunit n=1 Tax=Colwellia sp. M166 TaxID=2583805 RepID=UPI00211E06D6|nr:efflux RND transporter permease subunit [Colwellia sp. M166]UUO25295.1 efflux RND transporter permease subunit [Colwellia sp. M166]|tara:strand:- start:248 stop:3289 length:3042 start_codon:yes stop_codon:yes gene_type:complete
MDIARFSLTKPINIWLLSICFIIGGIVAMGKIGRLEDPAFTIKQAVIFTYYPGASAEKVEKEVTEQVEIALQQMWQLDTLTSVSKPGFSRITMEIQPNIDGPLLPQIWDELRKRLRDIEHNLPLGASAPVVVDDFGDVYGIYYALSAPDFSADQMREFARIIRREVLTVDGVAKVKVGGILEEEIVATIDSYQIAGLGLSFPDIQQVLASNLKPFSGGRLYVGDKQIRIPVESSTNKITEIENLSIVVPGNNASIKIKDIAKLSLQPVAIPSGLKRFNGEQAITLAVSAQNDINIVDVGQHIEAKLTEVLAKLPAGIEVSSIYNQAKIVDESVDGFILNLEASVAVVTLALCIFMGWRSGVVVGGTLLITVLGTVLIMWLYDLQLQRISLGAMVIAMGMLVDNAIVVAEGMMLRMEKGKSAMESASFIVRRTQWPLLGATVIGIAAFSGIGLSDDATGEFLFSLFAVVLISLMLSWVLAVTLTPLLGKYFYKVGDKEGQEESHSLFHKAYLVVLRNALHWRGVTLAILVAITIGAYASFGLIKQGFFPPSNTPVFFVHYWGAQDSDIRATEKYMKAGEKLILDTEGIESTATFIGESSERFTLVFGPELPNESYGLFLVRAYDAADIPRLAQEVSNKLRAANPNVNFYAEIMQFGPGAGAKIQARFSGEDPAILRDLAEQAKAIYFADGKIRDIRDDWRDKGIVLAPEYDDIAAGTAGVSRSDFSQAIKFYTDGLQIGQLQDGDYLYPIIARNSNTNPDQLVGLQNSLVWSSSQRTYVPFKQVSGKMNYTSEELLINRRDRVRTITVKAEAGYSETTGEAFNRTQAKIEAISLPQGYQLQWGGEYESSRDAQAALGQGLPLGFLVMFLISVLLFGRARQPIIIWLIVPMAVVGVVAGLLLADLPFGFMSLLGFLSLFGMLIKNAIVLLEEIDLQIIEGKEKDIAIVEASLSRLRPVSLAAITTILGVMPLILDPFFADMSVTIMGGLAFATILTMIAVPVLYSVFYKIKVTKY